MNPVVWKCDQTESDWNQNLVGMLVVLLSQIFQECRIHALDFFRAFSLWNAMYLPFLLLSSSAINLKCLSEVSAITFKLFATSLKACLFDLTCCLFLWGATIFCLLVSWLSPVSRVVASSECWMFSLPISTSLSWPPSLEISSTSSSSSFHKKDVSPALDVKFVTSFVSEKTGSRYFHQCGFFSGGSLLPFLIELCTFDHSYLKESSP